MNKHCYRIIFNKTRGLLMAVAETAPNQGKTRGATATPSSHRPRVRLATLKPLTFLVWRSLGWVSWMSAMIAPAAHAQIVADPGAPGNQRPTVLNASNGVPLVNIQTPSAAGVSRNVYNQFDVQAQGAILNNSRTNAQTQLGGWVQGNPWLATGSARVILNEVNASDPSLLKGYVEVAGQRAQVVIANPAGVSCDGCGFINANRATLTTGTPILDGGNLEGYRVQDGTVSISGLGLDAGSADYTDILARAVQINAGIWANQLAVVAGANQIGVDPASGAAQVTDSVPGTGPAPAFAIDTALLGGMYAGKITLIATEAGVGVRHAGKLYASAGDVIITANGQLENAGHLTSRGDTLIDAQDGVQNTGIIYAQGNLALGTRGDIGNSGSIAAQGNASLAASGADSRIDSTAEAILAAGVRTDGTIDTTGTLGNLTLAATRRIAAQGRNLSGADQSLTAQAVDLSASQTSANNLTITASSGDIDLSDATLAASQTLSAHASQTLRTDAANLAARQIDATAHDLSNVQGRIIAGQAIDLSITQLADNTQGLLGANGRLSLDAARIDNTGGVIGSVQDALSLTARTGELDNTAGRIEAAGAASLSSNGLINTDGAIIGQSLSVDTQQQTFDNTHGQLVATGSEATEATDVTNALHVQSGALINDGGLIQSAAALAIDTHDQTLSNTHSSGSAGIVAQGSLRLDTGAGDLDNQTGYIGSNGALTLNGAAIINTHGGAIIGTAAASIDAGALDNQGGQIQAAGPLDITLSGLLDNTGSLVRSGQALRISAAGILNAQTQGDDQGLEGNDVALNAASIANASGAIRANRDATLASRGLIDNADGLISAGNHLTLRDPAAETPPAHKTLALTNTGGTLIAGRQLTIDSDRLSGDGNVLSQGDLNVTLQQSLTNTGQIIANGNATVATAATLTNQSTLAAAGTLTARAATIDNQATGTITAARIDLQATDSHTLTNRGLINGGETLLQSPTLDNLGTGRIYGDHVAIGATTLNNRAEDGIAPVIAARERLDIGALLIDNRGHALLFSGGDIAIGGSLDADWHATGTADRLNNASASIEATGALDIAARIIDNTNQDFSTAVETIATQSLTEYQGAGSPNRYAPDAPDVYIYNDESDHLHTPEGNHESWSAYRYTRTTTETRVQTSDPARITAGGDLRLTADTVNNDKSHIIAGGTLSGTIGTLNNTEVAGERVITDAGTVTSYWRNHEKGRDSTGVSVAGYVPAPVIQAISLTPTVYLQHTAPTGSGATLAALTTASLGQAPDAAGSAAGATPGSRASSPTTPIVQVMLPGSSDANDANDPASVIRSGGIDTRVPDSRLFGLTPDPSAHYLIETDPAFADYRAWLSSDYMLAALALDPAATQKRLGDGFYEQKLIREQVAQLTGRRFLAGYADDEAQYAALMDNGLTFAQAYGLIPGVALSAAQMAALTRATSKSAWAMGSMEGRGAHPQLRLEGRAGVQRAVQGLVRVLVPSGRRARLAAIALKRQGTSPDGLAIRNAENAGFGILNENGGVSRASGVFPSGLPA
jgi:filamentous hemagglutinin